MAIRRFGRAAAWLTAVVLAVGMSVMTLAAFSTASEAFWFRAARGSILAAAVVAATAAPWWALAGALLHRHQASRLGTD